MPKFVVDYSKLPGSVLEADRLDAPAFHRNRAPIHAAVTRLLGDRNGDVLEIGSGTGQHAVALAGLLPRLTWWPSDPNPAHRASIAAWTAGSGLGNIAPPGDLDAAGEDWGLGGDGAPPAELAAILCINVLHISPWAATEGLIGGAARHLAGDGTLIVYGPFKRDGAHIADSNAAFDRTLRARDPSWGVRDTAEIAALAEAHGLVLAEIADMPSNNFILVLTRG